MTSTLELLPQPRSVREARVWVGAELRTLGRADLADSAQLCVSELVTNAILHADPPIVLRLRGTPSHPRVEVQDHSSAPPSVGDLTDSSRLLATVGRGLGIVAVYAATWGAEVLRPGKVVWFEPTAEPSIPAEGEQTIGDLFDLSELVDALPRDTAGEDTLVHVRLQGMPTKVFAGFRVWFNELQREVRLLALNHGAEYPLAHEFSTLTVRSAHERRQARGVDALDAALAAGLDQVDLDYDVFPSAPATMARMRELLDQLDVFCREERLLTPPASAQQLQLRWWYYGEFDRQGRGEPPQRWTGGYVVEDGDVSAGGDQP